jgi:hypothetical protein
MSNNTKQHPNQHKPETRPETTSGTRKYEESGLYPENGKPFRLWALLGWLTLLIIALAGVAALLNFLLLP